MTTSSTTQRKGVFFGSVLIVALLLVSFQAYYEFVYRPSQFVFTVTIGDVEIEPHEITVRRGGDVVLQIVNLSGEQMELEVEGYGVRALIPAGATVTERFVADMVGEFDVCSFRGDAESPSSCLHLNVVEPVMVPVEHRD